MNSCFSLALSSEGLPSRHGVPGEAGLGHEHLDCSPEGMQWEAFVAVAASAGSAVLGPDP